MNNDKFQPIPNRSEIIPDVETFRVTESNFFISAGIIILPDYTKINAIIRYKLVDDGYYDTTLRPVEYKEVEE